MTIYETRTTRTPAEVIADARSFFALAASPYAAFPEREGNGCLRLHLEVGEIVIGTGCQDGATVVRGSASRGAHLLAQFLTTLAAPLNTMQTTRRRGCHQTRGAHVEARPAPDGMPEPAAPSVPLAA